MTNIEILAILFVFMMALISLVIACVALNPSVVTANGFASTQNNGKITLETTVSGIIKGENHQLVSATNQDITNALLTDLSTNMQGSITSTDSILSAFSKLTQNRFVMFGPTTVSPTSVPLSLFGGDNVGTRMLSALRPGSVISILAYGMFASAGSLTQSITLNLLANNILLVPMDSLTPFAGSANYPWSASYNITITSETMCCVEVNLRNTSNLPILMHTVSNVPISLPTIFDITVEFAEPGITEQFTTFTINQFTDF
jgi:hypothetical protein